MTFDNIQVTDRYAVVRFNEDAWSLLRTAALAMWPLNVERASNWDLLSIYTWNECPIARTEAADELGRRGVQV